MTGRAGDRVPASVAAEAQIASESRNTRTVAARAATLMRDKPSFGVALCRLRIGTATHAGLSAGELVFVKVAVLSSSAGTP
jgi:hypothetical protein